MMNTHLILPGATIGILGSGQLGRMLALEARALGYRVHVFSPEPDSPTAAVADREFIGDYADETAVRDFAKTVDVVTFEFENIPVEATKAAAECTLVRPDGKVLHITQNRLREKRFILSKGLPVTPFREVRSLEDLHTATEELGLPGVLKTADFGYDGKGQVKILAHDQLTDAWQRMNGVTAIYEKFVSFEKELSVVAARSANGEFVAYPVFENTHSHHILDVTLCPALISPKQSETASELARQLLESLEVVGVLTVELFLALDGSLLINELAPRVHNSGHLTIDACITSQFEQQIRAVCGLPLGSSALFQPAAMVNLLGDVWCHGDPSWGQALKDPRVKLHLYGKRHPRPGRKMGHMTAAAPTQAEAAQAVVAAKRRLSEPRSGI